MLNKIVVLLISIYSFDSSASWLMKKNYGDVSIYMSDGKTRLALTSKREKGFIKEVSVKLLKKLEADKSKLLSLAGIKSWKVSSYNKLDKEGYSIAFLYGEYIDKNDVRVHFREYHYFGKKRKLTILLTNSNLEILKKDSTKGSLAKIVSSHDL